MNFDIDRVREIFQGGFHLSTKSGQIKRKDLAYIPRKDDRKTRQALADLEKNRNHSWFEEIYERNKHRLDSVALVYRENKITYGDMFDNMKKLARSLKSYGIKKGDEIPVCLSNTPELIYIMGAASMIGAKINVFGPKFDSEYVTKILNGTGSSIIFLEDNFYDNLKSSIEQSNVRDIVLISLADSLKSGIHPIDKKCNVSRFTSKVEEYKKDNANISSFADFMKLNSKDFDDNLISDEIGLDTEFSVTYTSGSTNAKHPKQIVHNNRSFITIARYHDPDTVGGIDMSQFTVEALIPTYSNTDLISCISDSLMQGSKLALEPIGDQEFFLDSLLINQPHYIVATTSYWIYGLKKAQYNPYYHDATLPNLLFAFAAGEGMSVNEEKFLNKGLKKLKAGSNYLPPFLKSIVMSAAGGDCEHGGIFYILFKCLFEKGLKFDYQEEAGLKLMDFAELAVLDVDGHYCSKGEVGRIVVNSGCSMEYYKDDPEATNKFFVTDAYGKMWGDCSIYGYVDKKNRVHIKGRVSEADKDFPLFYINDEVLKDQTNILSSLTVHVTDNGKDYYIVHFEKMPESTKDTEIIMKEALQRIKDAFGEGIASRVLFREHNFEESFALTGSGKRDYQACQNEEISENTMSINLDSDIQKVLKR